MWWYRHCKCNRIAVTHFPFEWLIREMYCRHEMMSGINMGTCNWSDNLLCVFFCSSFPFNTFSVDPDGWK